MEFEIFLEISMTEVALERYQITIFLAVCVCLIRGIAMLVECSIWTGNGSHLRVDVDHNVVALVRHLWVCKVLST